MDLIRDTWPLYTRNGSRTNPKNDGFFNVEVAETVTRRVKYMVAISKSEAQEYRPSAEQETYLEGNNITKPL